MQFHTYADDTQLYLNFKPDNVKINSTSIDFNDSIDIWMKHHFLKLNLFPIMFDSFLILVDKDTKLNFNTVTQAKNLGFIIDDALS